MSRKRLSLLTNPLAQHTVVNVHGHGRMAAWAAALRSVASLTASGLNSRLNFFLVTN